MISPTILQSLLNQVRESASPEVWSRGVELSRSAGIYLESESEDLVILKVLVPGRAVAAKVSFWPKELAWHCDLDNPEDPCPNVASAIIALKHGKVLSKTEQEPEGGRQERPKLIYHFSSQDSQLTLLRFLKSNSAQRAVRGPLPHLLAGIKAGRVEFEQPEIDTEDLAVDKILSGSTGPTLLPQTITALLGILSRLSSGRVFFDMATIAVSAEAVVLGLEIVAQGSGFRLRRVLQEGADKVFENGAVLKGETLHAARFCSLAPHLEQLVRAGGTYFGPDEVVRLVSQIVPELETENLLVACSEQLPRAEVSQVRLLFDLDSLGQTLCVLPRIVYGQEPIAEVNRSGLSQLLPRRLPKRDIHTEKLLAEECRRELGLEISTLRAFSGEDALAMRAKLRAFDCRGSGANDFLIRARLSPQLQFDGGNLSLEFAISPSETGESGVLGVVSGQEVIQAWQEGRSALYAGENCGWVSLPDDWLDLYAERVKALLAQRTSGKALPRSLTFEAISLLDDCGVSYDRNLKEMKEALEDFRGIPSCDLPKDLRAELRSYQKQGIDWLSFLKKCGFGAVLADDMGLGKTLQALCIVDGPTLVVAPTSVLHSWREQSEKFRPGLSINLYHGPSRTINQRADITLTSYAILRLDQDILANISWANFILDEAQTIKNPDSQMAQSCYRIKADFALCLSGTPIENSLTDLWSQFHVANRGLLGSRNEFGIRFGQPIAQGNAVVREKLKRSVKPFILRRMKEDVAKDLPPRTELILKCELSQEERELYNAIYAGTRHEVLSRLDKGQSLFGALEALLRLRQACCHSALVPDSKSALSSKTDLLLESLTTVIEEGHRALIFSQWTSLLDLIGPKLTERNISYARLDGSTPNREDVVHSFQAKDGPPVMLLSLKAGGVGLTLTAADYVFFMDTWWNPAVERQAADRAHRIGQERPVVITRLIAEGTIEERVLEIQKRKAKLAESILSEAAEAVSLTGDDLRELFA